MITTSLLMKKIYIQIASLFIKFFVNYICYYILALSEYKFNSNVLNNKNRKYNVNYVRINMS